MENPWPFFLFGYLFSILIETPILLVGLSPRHPMSRRFFAGVWLTACTYPIVAVVLPLFFDPGKDRFRYLLAAETFAPVAECLLFLCAFGLRESIPSVEHDSDHANLSARSESCPTDAAASSETNLLVREKQEGITTPPVDTGLLPSPEEEPASPPDVGKVDYGSVGRDMATIVVANLASFGLGELVYALGWVDPKWFGGS